MNLFFNRLSLWWRRILLAGMALLAFTRFSAAEILPPGNRPVPVGVHALVGGKIVIKPGEILDSGTVLIRDGLIEKVGTNISTPPDASVWDMKGMTIYAGFIDPYLMLSHEPAPDASKKKDDLTAGRFFGVPGGERDPGNPGPGYDMTTITPEFRVERTISPDIK